ncbi:MAG: ATP-binding cassette domain-containing protein, partial [bacterium]|nr:ATP-binding cassette domain-containing protein [bacterium]
FMEKCNMIELKQVSKSYGEDVIFEDVNLKLEEGTVTCFIGNNGHGKSTLLKVISGLLTKSSGEIISNPNYRFAYVPEKFSAVNMRAGTYLNEMAAMDALYSPVERKQIIAQLAAEFCLSDMLDKPMKKLSKGSLQKVVVIQALMRKPDVLLLDEPLSGQDVDSQQVFISKVKELKKNGAIILLSAHEEHLINSLSDFVYTIQNKHVTLYKEKEQRSYAIVAELTENVSETMTVCEKQLSVEVDRIIREGWHIRKIYEIDE